MSQDPTPRSRQGRKPSARAEIRTEELLTAAAIIFSQRGYDGASLQDIADAVGLLKGSLYYYVRSKEDILYLLTLRVHAIAMENLEQAANLVGDPIDKMSALVRGHIRSFRDDQAMVHVFYREYQRLSEERYKEMMVSRHRYEAFCTDLIIQGQSAGLFEQDMNPKVTAIGILTMLNSVPSWFDPNGQFKLDDIEEHFDKFVLRSLGAPKSRLRKRAARRQKAPATPG